MQIPNNNNCKSQEGKVKKILYNEVNFVLGVISIVGVVYALFFGASYKVQKQIDSIKHEIDTTTKLSAQLQNIKDNDMHTLAQNDIEIKKQLQDIIIQIVKLQTTIEERTSK